MKTDHTIAVDFEPEAAFAIGLDVSQWPQIFPPCLAARVLEESEAEQKIAITARANGQVFSWQSVREVDRSARTISFHQSKTSPLVKSMSGTWSFEDAGAGCVIRLTHEFEIADEVNGAVPGVETKDDATVFMMNSVDTNSTKELAAIGKHLERKSWSHTFEESLIVDAAGSLVRDLLWDAEEWPSLLLHCTGMEVLYDDGLNQEFIMTVEVGETVEEIRSIRHRGANEITYFQPTPPDPLLEHRGRWTAEPSDAGTEIVSFHEVRLNPEFWQAKGKTAAEAKQIVEDAINRNSAGTMNAIKNHLGA